MLFNSARMYNILISVKRLLKNQVILIERFQYQCFVYIDNVTYFLRLNILTPYRVTSCIVLYLIRCYNIYNDMKTLKSIRYMHIHTMIT